MIPADFRRIDCNSGKNCSGGREKLGPIQKTHLDGKMEVFLPMRVDDSAEKKRITRFGIATGYRFCVIEALPGCI